MTGVRALASTFLFTAASLALAGCGHAPGRPKPGPEVPRPDKVLNFAALYSNNCAACHGEQGKDGLTTSLSNPEYLAWAGKDTLLKVTANGVSNKLMPAFAKSAGGMLTDGQVNVIVDGMLGQWGRPGILNGENPPPYSSAMQGNASQGQLAFRTYCARCHGADGKGTNGKGTGQVGSIVDPDYLALVSAQALRTILVVGLPERNMPDWRGDVPGHPMTDADVTNIVAWLVSHRTQFPGQPYSQRPAR